MHVNLQQKPTTQQEFCRSQAHLSKPKAKNNISTAPIASLDRESLDYRAFQKDVSLDGA